MFLHRNVFMLFRNSDFFDVYDILHLKMELPNFVKSFSPLEGLLFLVFVVFIVFPVSIPRDVAVIVDSPLGMVSIVGITAYLFLYSHPVVAVTYIIVAYELLRRSSMSTGKIRFFQTSDSVFYPQTSRPTNEVVMTVDSSKSMNNLDKINQRLREKTLEEEIVKTTVPNPILTIPSTSEGSSFQPVSDKIIAGVSPVL